MSQEIQHDSDNASSGIQSDLLTDDSTNQPHEDKAALALVAQYVYDGLMTPEEATCFAQGRLVWQEG
jgi:hypothetical protein